MADEKNTCVIDSDGWDEKSLSLFDRTDDVDDSTVNQESSPAPPPRKQKRKTYQERRQERLAYVEAVASHFSRVQREKQ